MKSLLRNTVINSVTLLITSQFLSGVKIEGDWLTFLIIGIVFYILSLILSPILKIITLPLNVATLGFFSFLINIPILYLLTIIMPQVKISSFMFQGATLAGFVIPKMYLSSFFAFIAASVVFSVIISCIKWLVER